jgi:50S ribosomal subunit-associated GTPase HflX
LGTRVIDRTQADLDTIRRDAESREGKRRWSWRKMKLPLPA